MRKLIAGAAVLALALSWGAGQAAAEVKVRFQLTNEDTHMTGKHISASPGDRLVLKLFVQNLERATAEITTDLEAAIPGCIVNAQDVDTYKQKRNKKSIDLLFALSVTGSSSRPLTSNHKIRKTEDSPAGPEHLCKRKTVEPC